MSENTPVMFAEGHKYSLLALPHLSAAAPARPLMIAAEGYALSNALPLDEAEWLQNTFGVARYRNMNRKARYLVVYARSKRPDMLDHENRVLNRRLQSFHLGLLIGCPFLSHEESFYLEGARRNGFTEIRGSTTYPAVVGLRHGPVPLLNNSQLQYGLELGIRARHIRRTDAGKRFGRVLSAFRTGLHERSLDARLHQFTRCVEGFLGSWNRHDFATRASHFVTGISEYELLQIYAIRSAVEHLSGWERDIAVKGRAGKERVLVERAVQCQALAHSFISRFLENRPLWAAYVSDASVKTFWKDTDNSARAALWGERFDIGRFTAHLNVSDIHAALHTR